MAKSILIIGHDANDYRALMRARFPTLDIRIAARADEIGPEAVDAAALFGFSNALNDALIAKMNRLEWLQFLSSGTDALHRLPSLGRDVFVTSTHGVHGPPVAEMTFLHMLVLARDYQRLFRQQLQGQWIEHNQPLLFKKTVTILGVGLIAEELARRCKAFGMTVLGVSKMLRQVEGFDRIYARDELKKAASLADFFVLLVPLSPETQNIVDAEVIAALKPAAYLINVARGGVCDEDALLAALRDRKIAGAGLDVFRAEPLPSDHPFWRTEHAVITPHVAGRSDLYAELVAPILLRNIECFLGGRMNEMANLRRR
jgi:phosphoglycerate dehydrogenase-like enzyme